MMTNNSIICNNDNSNTVVLHESDCYSKEQVAAITYATTTTAFISLVCSIFIIQHVIRSSKNNKVKTYHRLLFGLSLWDVVSSGAILGSGIFEIMIADDDWEWAAGTLGCTAKGFISVVSVGGAGMYNACLAIFFWLVVQFQLSDHTVATRFEPALHVVSNGFPISMGISGLFLQAFNPRGIGQGCGFKPYPAIEHCDDDSCWERGGESALKLRDTMNICFFGIVFVLLFTNISMYCNIRRTEEEQRNQIHFQGSSGPAELTMIGEDEHVNREQAPSSSTTSRAKKLAVQSSLFCAGYFLTYILAILQSLLSRGENVGTKENFVLGVFTGIFWPLQGFFDFLVYFRPRYLNWRRRNPSRSRWFAMKQATLTVRTPITTTTTSTHSCFCQCCRLYKDKTEATHTTVNHQEQQQEASHNNIPQQPQQLAMVVLIDDNEEEQRNADNAPSSNDAIIHRMEYANDDAQVRLPPSVVTEHTDTDGAHDVPSGEEDEGMLVVGMATIEEREGSHGSPLRQGYMLRRFSYADAEDEEQVLLDETDERIAEALHYGCGSANKLYTANHLDTT